MILDCDLCYGATNNGSPYLNCDTFDELLAELGRAGIDGGLVRSRYSDTVGVNYGNSFVSRDVKKGREKGFSLWGVWALLPPFTGETPAPDELPRTMAENDIAAVYIAPRNHRYMLDPITLGETFAVLEDRRIPLVLETALGVTMDQIYTIMREHPKLTAIVGDQESWPNGRMLYPLAYTYENLRIDLSYIMDAGGVEDMTKRFGAEKLLFGTAFPDRYTGSMLAVVRSADISEKDREAIFGGNLAEMIKTEDLV